MAREHRPRRLQIARNARECATRACVLAAAAFGDLGGGPGGSGMEATAREPSGSLASTKRGERARLAIHAKGGRCGELWRCKEGRGIPRGPHPPAAVPADMTKASISPPVCRQISAPVPRSCARMLARFSNWSGFGPELGLRLLSWEQNIAMR